MSIKPVVLLCVVSLPLLVACGGVGGDRAGSGPQVVAAFYPFAYVAERVAGSHAQITNLTTPGLEPHDLELTPQQVAEISAADVVIYEHGFQPTVDDAVEQNSPKITLDVTEVVPLQDTGTPADDNGDLKGDPHLWQDPTLLVTIVDAFAESMAKTDPDNAADYRTNAQALVQDLMRLDHEFTAGLSTCERNDFVTSHAAFGYLAHRYGLNMIAIAGLSPDVEPSPARLAELQDLIERDGITTVFSEVLGSKKYAETLAGDLNLRADVLNPIEGLPDKDSSEDYLSLMRRNLSALREANGCS